MSYPNNPQAVFNGFVSVSRNIYLTSSVAVAMFGYSNSFKITSSDLSVKLISIFIFMFSMGILLNGTISFKNYLNNLEKEELPYYVDSKAWRRFIYLNYSYLVILSIIFVLSLRRTSNKFFF